MILRQLLRQIRNLDRTESDEITNDQIRIPFVKEIIPKNGVGAELGVYKGTFTRCLLDVSNPSALHIVDPWYLMESEWTWGLGNRSTVDALIRILDEFRRELVGGRIVLNIGFDLDVLATFPDQYFDWVYLDTNHQYLQTQKELQILKLKVKKDGVIAGDDWHSDPSHPHHGVCRAVNEFVDREPYKVIYADGSDLQWAIKSD